MARVTGLSRLTRLSPNRASANRASANRASLNRASLNRASASSPSRGRQLAAAGLLGAACCAWAAWPLHGDGAAGGPLRVVLLVVAAALVLADLIRLTVAGLPLAQVDVFSSLSLRATYWVHALLDEVPSAEAAAVAVLALEATHTSRPWHTGVLGAALLCYLLAIHLTETGAPARVLRPQLPALTAGLGLLILGAAAALVPAAAPSLASGLLRVLAAVAAIAAGALALPL